MPVKVTENKAGVKFISVVKTTGRNQIVRCVCPICGETFEMYRSHFYRGSNGCKCNKVKNARIHSIWENMKTRCYNTNNPSFKNYGGRGIAICEEWKNSYKAFERWALSSGYSDELTIDRKDNNGNYTPRNCRWTDNITQARNRRNSVHWTVRGITRSSKEWCELIDINYKRAMELIYKGQFDKLTRIIEDFLDRIPVKEFSRIMQTN